MTLSILMSVVALMNGMIGGTILVLPILFLHAGLIPSLISLLIMGIVNELSCRICVYHLGSDKDLPQTLNRHSNGHILASKIYNILLCIGNMFVCMMYFQLICIQWELILDSPSKKIALINALVVFILILVLKYFNFGTKLLGYGIMSILSYIIFLVWVFLSRPSGNKQIPLWTWNFNQIFNALSTAFAIQGVFVPIIRKCNQQESYGRIILMTFLFGGLVYSFIGFAGSFGIVNRVPYLANPQTIEEYFSNKDIPVIIIACIYLFHLYTALPEYLVIGIQRLLSLFKIQTSHQLRWEEIIAIFLSVFVCLCTSILDVQLSVFLAINGSLIAFFSTYLVPVYIHIRCYYFPQSQKEPIALIQMKDDAKLGSEIVYKSEKQKSGVVSSVKGLENNQNMQVVSGNIDSEIIVETLVSECVKTNNRLKRKLLLGVNIFLIIFGVLVLSYTLYTHIK